MTKVGDLLWTPSEEWIANSNLSKFMSWLEQHRKLKFGNYQELWRWSVEELEQFWQAVWDYFEIKSSKSAECVLASRKMPGAKWFPGARLNYAENLMRREMPGEPALLHLTETAPLTPVLWDDLGVKVRVLATQLRRLGVAPGDRVVAYMPNIPEAVIAMLATTSIGAIWASCSPDFGTRGVLDRLTQLEPKVLFCVDGYRYGGKDFDRRAEIAEIINQLPSLENVVYLPYLNKSDRAIPFENAGVFNALFDELLDQPPIPPSEFEYEQVPFDHPLWILFSSGTTGLPKPIVHGHGGILLEMEKLIHFHMDMHPGERMFFFTTTGWMMWNFLASAMLAGVVPVLYDGNPAYPQVDLLWKMVEDSGASFFGASPTFVDIMVKEGIVPKERYDMSSLRAVMPAGSPVSAECTAWFYQNVKEDLWVASGSGGTDVCTGLVGGVPILPVYAGEIQAPSLGVAAAAFNEQGEAVVDEMGELVITEPMPSMPVGFWNDTSGERYREAYFQEFPGVWRHGDFFKINSRGGCFVLGRSDSVLNRHGVRIGTAEIYRTLALLDEVEDSLIVNLDLPGGKFFMPLFVKLADGLALNSEIEKKICATLRREYSPRHVPDKIYQVSSIPATLTGKKMEVPVRKILLGAPPEKAANRSAMRDPHALEYFIEFAREHKDYSLT